MQSVLDPIRHARLLKDKVAVCQRAGISERHLHESMKEACGPAEVAFVQATKTSTAPGMMLYGPRALDRCMYMAGAYVRNFIDARVMTLEQMVEGDAECTVLLCPNFYTTTTAKGFPQWKQQKLFDLLVDRYKSGKKTVLWAESHVGLKEYGAAMEGLLREYLQAHSV